MKKLRNGICAVLALVLILSCVCGCGGKKEFNVFSQYVKVADDTILPRNVTFGQTLEAAMQERNLTEEDITGYRDRYIITRDIAPNSPYTIHERLSFTAQGNELFIVAYIIEVAAEAKEETFAALYEQAKAVLPDPDPHLNSFEGMKNGEMLVWTDKDNNTLSFSCADAVEGNIAVVLSMRGGAYQRNLQSRVSG